MQVQVQKQLRFDAGFFDAYSILKGDIYFESFPSVCYIVLVHENVVKGKKVQIQTNRRSSLPQKTLLLKRLVSSPPIIPYLCDIMLRH